MIRQAALALLMFPVMTHAQDALPAANSSGAVEIPVLQKHLVYAGTKDYPKDLADRGVQGTTTLRASLTDDGRLSNPVIVEPSGSEELDRSAVALVSGLRLKLNPKATKPTEVVLPILFLKDSVSILHTKTCAEFNIDHDYFTRTFPGKDIAEMTVFEMAAGVVYASAMSNPMQLINKIKSARSDTATKCAASPKSKFLEVYLKAMR